MADKLYVWNEIRHGEPGEGDKSGDTKVFKRGDSVSKSDFAGMSDEEFDQLIAGGTLRTMKYPDMPETYQGSPVEYMREQARKAAEAALLDVSESDVAVAAVQAEIQSSSGTAQISEVEQPQTQQGAKK